MPCRALPKERHTDPQPAFNSTRGPSRSDRQTDGHGLGGTRYQCKSAALNTWEHCLCTALLLGLGRIQSCNPDCRLVAQQCAPLSHTLNQCQGQSQQLSQTLLQYRLELWWVMYE